MSKSQTGWLVPSNNPECLAEKITYILDPVHKAEVASVVARAWRLIEEKYDWQIIAAQFNNLFVNLIKNV